MTRPTPAPSAAATRIVLPELALVVLAGASGSGKSTFAARHFAPGEVLSSDACRQMVADDPDDQAATADAFDVLRYIAGKRLRRGRLTVVDATSVRREDRADLVALAREHDVLPVAIVLDLPEQVCLERNAARADRHLPAGVIRRQRGLLRRSLGGLAREGFRRVTILRTPEEVDAASVEREPLWTDRRGDHGPFDIVGDVHGCHAELVTLLEKLGWVVAEDGSTARHPGGRRAVFLGDLVDRGPASPEVLRLVMGMVADGTALCVAGNHEAKLLRALRARARPGDAAPRVSAGHGLAATLEQLQRAPEELVAALPAFLDSLVSHYVLDGGNLVVAHAGLKEAYHNRSSGRVRAFALYGDTSGETDEFGLPVRYPWAQDYRGRAMVVYGHTPVVEPEWVNHTICIDTGCVFGGRLTALRYPERELVWVPAQRTWYQPVRPLGPPSPAPADREPLRLDVADVLGKRVIDTRLLPRVTISAEQALAALEVMGRFATDPRWLVHLPPTMAPTATSRRVGLLEHPAEALAAYRHDGVGTVVAEAKHMGSRALVVACRDPAAAQRRFGLRAPAAGTVFTRTGRPFFTDQATEAAVLERVRAAVTAAGLWEELATDWLLLDAELLPWSAKAGELLRGQYAAVGAAGVAGLGAAGEVLQAAAGRGVDAAGPLLERARARQAAVRGYVDAYRRYRWPVTGVDDLRLAVFTILAGEGGVHALRDRRWHLRTAGRLAEGSPLLIPTEHRVVDVTDPDAEAAATAWWEELTAAGGEGIVVKPLEYPARSTGRRGPVQPGLKVRGPGYLTIVYGPEYRLEGNLERLRDRGLNRKRALAAREFALGVEALERFVRGEPLHRVHECVFGVLALESEPVDPRL